MTYFTASKGCISPWIFVAFLVIAIAPHSVGAQTGPGVLIDEFIGPVQSSGGLDDPTQLVFGPDGQLYATSSATNEVIRYDGETGNLVDIVVESSADGPKAPQAMAFGPDGHLYVGKGDDGFQGMDIQIYRYDINTGALIDTFLVAPGREVIPTSGFVFGPDDHLYVNHADLDAIVRYDGSSGAVIDTFVVERSGGLNEPVGLTFGPDGNLYVAASNKVFRYDGTTGEFIDMFVDDASSITRALIPVFGPDGDLYLAKEQDDIYRYSGETGEFVERIPDRYEGRDVRFGGIAFGTDGLLYAGDFFLDEVLRYDPAAGAFADLFVFDLTDGPAKITFGPDGNLYLGYNQFDRINRYDGETGTFIDRFVEFEDEDLPDGFVAGFRGIAFGPDGHLYVCAANLNQVLRYDGMTGEFLDVFIDTGSGDEELGNPWDLYFNFNGSLFVSNNQFDRVPQYNDSTGAFVRNFVRREQGGLDSPLDFTFSPAGGIYVYGEGKVFRFGAVNPVLIEGSAEWGPAPTSFEFGSDEFLYGVSALGNQVLRYDHQSGDVLDVFVESHTALRTNDLIFGPDGNMYVATSGDAQVLRYTGPGISLSESVEEELPAPGTLLLRGNYPNPFSEHTRIAYTTSTIDEVTLEVYDTLGRRVHTRISKSTVPGRHEMVLEREELPAGVYFYRISAGASTQFGQVVIVQ